MYWNGTKCVYTALNIVYSKHIDRYLYSDMRLMYFDQTNDKFVYYLFKQFVFRFRSYICSLIVSILKSCVLHAVRIQCAQYKVNMAELCNGECRAEIYLLSFNLYVCT